MSAQDTFRLWLLDQMARYSLTTVHLACRLGVRQPTVSKWIGRTRLPEARSCYRLAKVFDVSPAFVLTAAGHKPGPTPGQRRRGFTEIQAKYMAAQPIQAPVYAGRVPVDKGNEVVDYSYIDGGRGAGRRIIGVRVHGSSMAPELLDGDTVIVDRDLSPSNGGIVLAYRGDEVLVRRSGTWGASAISKGQPAQVSPSTRCESRAGWSLPCGDSLSRAWVVRRELPQERLAQRCAPPAACRTLCLPRSGCRPIPLGEPCQSGMREVSPWCVSSCCACATSCGYRYRPCTSRGHR